MEKRKIAIACQGGGSHTAFTAGVLKKLLEKGITEKYDLIGLSGTSGGGVCAATAWYGLLKTACGEPNPSYKWLVDFWQDNSANLPWEKSLNALVIQSVRWQESGAFGPLAANPYASDWMLYWLQAVSPRREFLDFEALLRKHINFDEIEDLVEPSSPKLILGAVNILSGEFKAFDSSQETITVEKVMASAAIPLLFKAVEIGENAYWDGLFVENPPISKFLDVNVTERPDEIWVIKVNPQTRKTVPITSGDIQDRRNELSGNISISQDVKFIELVNQWIAAGCFQDNPRVKVKPIQVRFIEMSSEISEHLDYASKLNRDSCFIKMLMSDGEKQAEDFIKNLES